MSTPTRAGRAPPPLPNDAGSIPAYFTEKRSASYAISTTFFEALHVPVSS